MLSKSIEVRKLSKHLLKTKEFFEKAVFSKKNNPARLLRHAPRGGCGGAPGA
jgi:hypothetical protein